MCLFKDLLWSIIDIIKGIISLIIFIYFKILYTMLTMFINFISVLHTSWMILREVGPVEANLYKILFDLWFDPSAEDDAAARLSLFVEMKETSNIRLPPSPQFRFFFRFSSFKLASLSGTSSWFFFFFLILFLLLLYPPPPCLCRLRKWSQLVVITTSIFKPKLKFQRWIKGNIKIS